MMWRCLEKGCLRVLCRNATRPIYAPPVPPRNASHNNVDSAMRQLPFSARILSKPNIINVQILRIAAATAMLMGVGSKGMSIVLIIFQFLAPLRLCMKLFYRCVSVGGQAVKFGSRRGAEARRFYCLSSAPSAPLREQNHFTKEAAEIRRGNGANIQHQKCALRVFV
jgi:hypothetical protein